MAKSFIAVLLPEYDDSGNISTSFDWKLTELPDEISLNNLIKGIVSFVDFYKDEECKLIYDSKNIEAFAFVLKALPECYPNSERALRLCLKNIENWRKNSVSSEDDIYVLNRAEIKDEIRTEIASRMEKYSDDEYLVTIYHPDFKTKKWSLKKDGKTYSIESLPMSIKAVFDWLSKHRHPQRVYNWNEKHGEFGKGAHPDNKGNLVSVLMGSREEAAEIMPQAIGIPYYDEIYCFDNKYKKYMEYKAECKYSNLQPHNDIRKYHSYHIDDDSQIPKRVKEKLSLINN